MRHYQLGDTVQFEGGRGVLGVPLVDQKGRSRDAWFILTTPPQRERDAATWLARQGVLEAWFPTETTWQRTPKGRRRKVRYMRPIVPRYLFTCVAHQVNWDVLKDRGRGRILGVIGRGGAPAAIDPALIAEMRQVPGTLRALSDELERQRQQAEAARRPVAGDKATITAGALTGFVVEVTNVAAGMARFIWRSESHDIPGTARLESLVRPD